MTIVEHAFHARRDNTASINRHKRQSARVIWRRKIEVVNNYENITERTNKSIKTSQNQSLFTWAKARSVSDQFSDLCRYMFWINSGKSDWKVKIAKSWEWKASKFGSILFLVIKTVEVKRRRKLPHHNMKAKQLKKQEETEKCSAPVARCYHWDRGNREKVKILVFK